eukprot:CAMPEP_0180198532 /NCGR_PEP_ID=MMETSP0987-20121128/5231_1 /TAXON_ID=697907 /ORGANISM="non described non described, Strain CCMP2293" /LENGTH=106 /DNA_ID=CAMNT_0022153567 /DNA_START=1268 /DNA_END=1585 /DNA_ORIENTATION=-
MTSPYVPSPTRLRTTYRSMAAPSGPPPGLLDTAPQKSAPWAALLGPWASGEFSRWPPDAVQPTRAQRPFPKLPVSGGWQKPAPAQRSLASDAGPHPSWRGIEWPLD